MKRDEFMAQIARLLADLPESERMEAIRYYNDYLDEAGVENEEQAIEELGDPREIAENIKADLQENDFSRKQTVNHPPIEKTERRTQSERTTGTEERWQTEESMQMSGNMQTGEKTQKGKWILILILVILASPILLGLAGGLLGMILGLGGALLGVIFACLSTGVSLLLGGIALIVKGIWNLYHLPALGMAGVGGGLICGAVGILLLLLFGWFTFQIIPRIWRTCKIFLSGKIQKWKGGRKV